MLSDASSPIPSELKPPSRSKTIYTLIVLGCMAVAFIILFVRQHFLGSV